MPNHPTRHGAARDSRTVHTRLIGRRVALLASAIGAGIGLLVLAGSIRYGGFDGLVLRVRAEIAAHSHPSLALTPIAYDAGDAAAIRTPSFSRSPSPAILFPTPSPTPDLPATYTPGFSQSPFPATATAAPTPTCTPTFTPTPTLTSTPAHQPAAPSVALTGLVHMWQTWNNCGPATLAMALSYFGCQVDQAEVAQEMRPNREDKNVSPEELAAYARSQGLEALVRVNGDTDRLRLLLSNDLPVLIESWVEEEPGNGLGHYRLLTGYDDARREWIAYDSYISRGVDPAQPYQGIRLSYDEVAQHWAVFNHLYVVIYGAEAEPAVRSILGADYDDAAMWARALASAEEAARQRPEDAFAWFNLGTDLVAAHEFARAASAYDRARTIGLPWRMLWYQFGPFAAYYHSERYEELIALARATLEVTDYVEEIHYWLGMGLLATGDRDGAVQAWRHALALNGDYALAVEALIAADVPISEKSQP